MPNGPMKFSSGMSGDRPIRVRASFEYIGPALDHAEALRLWNGT
jgi:hypothetical protein